ncbi:hypothetical protein G6F31_021284 [Rhizopus arrhizus]|nr:hypothetical protein G6F31_021284 [Rhizopus arrhizus]
MADAHDQPVVEDRAQRQADEIRRRNPANDGGGLAGGVQSKGGQGRNESVADADNEQAKQRPQDKGQQLPRHEILDREKRNASGLAGLLP